MDLQATLRCDVPSAPVCANTAHWKRRLVRATAWVGIVLLGVTFVVASVPKIASPHEFAGSVYRYHLLPDALINPVAVLLPWVELTAAMCLLLVRPLRTSAFIVLGAMLIMFTAALIVSIIRGINVSCGCFSVAGEGGRIGWTSVARNVCLLGALVLSWRCAIAAGGGNGSTTEVV